MASGVNEIELDVDEGADRLGSLADFTFQHDNASIVEGSQSADAISVLTLGALDCRRIGVVPILMEGLEIVVKALQTHTIGNLLLHIRFLSVSLEGVLGSGPKAVGHSIVGKCLETTIAMSSLENWRYVQLATCQLSVH